MGVTSSPDPPTTPFESGMPRLVPQLEILSRGTLTWCCLLLTLPMGITSSPDPPTAPFESGMLRLALQSTILSRGTLTQCSPLPTLLMDATSSPDPTITPFESGILRLILQLGSLSGSIHTQSDLLHTWSNLLHTWSDLLHTPLMRGTSVLHLMTTPPVYWTHSHIRLSDLPLVTQSILILVQSLTRMVGSRTQRVAYYTLRKVHVVIFTPCGDFCGGFHHKCKSPHVLVVVFATRANHHKYMW